MHCSFLASVSCIHFTIIGNAVQYFVAGLEAVVVAVFLGVLCLLLDYFVAVVMLVASLRVMLVASLRMVVVDIFHCVLLLESLLLVLLVVSV